MATYETQVQPAAAAGPGTTTAATGTHEEQKLAKAVNEEYHDPLDDWGSRDTLLSLVPFIVLFMFKDVALNAGLAFGIGFSAFLLLMRTVAWDSRRKEVWPMLDLTTLFAWAILRGLNRHYFYWIYKWITVMIPLIFAVVAILTLMWRRPFVAHYARYPKFDRGGRGLWTSDTSYRRTCDIATMGWVSAWSVSLLLSLIPILTGHWQNWSVLNIIFNYIIPMVLLGIALIQQQLIGTWYRTTASKAAAAAAGMRGPGYPAGSTVAAPTGDTPRYSTAV